MNRRISRLGWISAALASVVVMGCSGAAAEGEEVGTLAFPLLTSAPSGVQYRLTNAIFRIDSANWYPDPNVPPPPSVVVSSDDNPDAPTIEVSLERGYYMVTLEPGWSFERVENGVGTAVEATLLNGEQQWAWIDPHSTSWLSYQFGIGDRSIWLNGKINIDVQVYENPDDYYWWGTGGAAGAATGGAPNTGGWYTTGGSSPGGAYATGGGWAMEPPVIAPPPEMGVASAGGAATGRSGGKGKKK